MKDKTMAPKKDWRERFDERFSSEWWTGFSADTPLANKEAIDSIKFFISFIEQEAYEDGLKDGREKTLAQVVEKAEEIKKKKEYLRIVKEDDRDLVDYRDDLYTLDGFKNAVLDDLLESLTPKE